MGYDEKPRPLMMTESSKMQQYCHFYKNVIFRSGDDSSYLQYNLLYCC